jgi:bifunctional non-homologous end joining protein LigD
MSLAKYKQMRRFDETPEPAGAVNKKRAKQLEFVIQKHDASHLHYDFRLEMDGVLKSWAVPKGPSLRPEDKRLAMMVEDHPYEYRKFEGVIPKGNYGGGNVIIWDRGTYEPLIESDNPEKELLSELKKGDLKIVMHGQKVKGAYALVKIKGPEDNSWLLIKKKDQYAAEADVTKQDRSVISGKTVEAVDLPAIDFAQAPKAKMPKNVKPMLATLTDESFDGDDWLFEIKWDGYRAISSWDGKTVRLYSRNGTNFVDKYPPVTEALSKLQHHVVLDGEIIAANEEGRSNFGWLQNYGTTPKGQLLYYAFDILWCDGHDLRDLPLIKRKKILKAVLPPGSSIRYSDHIVGHGKAFFATAEDQKLEGIMAKSCQSIYREGYRSKQWLKIKTHMRQEAVIGGFTEPRGSRSYIGALILGVYEDDKLIYVGHTGGGIPTKQLPILRQQLEKLERQTSPFASKFKPNAPVHWVQPKLVCEVNFSEWTDDGHMRQPIFLGVRQDKDAKDVRKELPKAAAKVKKETPKSAAAKSPLKKSTTKKLSLSHLDKVFFPEAGYTKGDLVEYYQAVGPTMLPYLKDRPHSLLRQPNGIHGESFFQKDITKPPDWIKTAAIYSESNKKDIHYFVCDTLDSLLYMVQLGCIEINPWNSTVKHLDRPDWCVIDLDPEDISFGEVVKVAKVVHQLCEELNVPSYPKTSGKTGIHIFIPLGAKYTYEQCKQLGEIMANMVHERVAKTTSLERSPKKRQKMIYLDFLQNRAGQTLAAPYSVRPTPEASVSTPLHWDEVNDKLDPRNFTIKNMAKRLDEVGDIWQPVLGQGIDIKQVLSKLS